MNFMKKILLTTSILLLLNGCSTSSNLTNQDKCSDKAKEFFSTNKVGSLDSYVNHYSRKLDKCYVLTKHFSVGGEKDELWNAYENKIIASCDSGYDGINKFCDYNGTNEKYDIEKFNLFIRQYIEE